MTIRILFVVLASCLLTACAGTTVVLVPDSDGKVGQVSLTTKGGSTLLTSANQSAEATKNEQAPTQPVKWSEGKIKDVFGKILANEPIPPKRYSLYFRSGSSILNPKARAKIDIIIAGIKARKSCDLSVIGHSDTVGNNKSNKGLSIRRAENVVKVISKAGIDRNCMDIRYYGESDLAVPTKDNVDEPLNRRTEVEIR